MKVDTRPPLVRPVVARIGPGRRVPRRIRVRGRSSREASAGPGRCHVPRCGMTRIHRRFTRRHRGVHRPARRWMIDRAPTRGVVRPPVVRRRHRPVADAGSPKGTHPARPHPARPGGPVARMRRLAVGTARPGPATTPAREPRRPGGRRRRPGDPPLGHRRRDPAGGGGRSEPSRARPAPPDAAVRGGWCPSSCWPC